MNNVKKAVERFMSSLRAELPVPTKYNMPSRKVPVAICLHPADIDLAKAAAASEGIAFNDFCALAIYKAAQKWGASL